MVRVVPRSVRTRLVLLFSVGTALVLLVCLLVLHEALDRQLDGALANDLSGRYDDLSAAVGGRDLRAVADDPLAQLYTADGALVTGSRSFRDRRLLTPQQVQAITRQQTISAELPAGVHFTAADVQILAGPTHRYVLAVAARSDVVDNAGGRQLVVLALAAPLLIAGLAAAGWVIVRATLRPVGLLSREAAAISSLDAERRLPVVGGDDEIARLAATLNQMLGRLQVAFARERAFVDDASHELRTPLAVLRGEIELALGALDDSDELEQSLRAAKTQAERLTRLADDLLMLARDREGTLALNRQPVDLLDLTLSEAASLGPALGLDISVTGDPVVIDADPSRLRQVFANLAANSAAARAAHVSAAVRVAHGDVLVEWADDGLGFSSAMLSAAFERFARGDTARTESGAGLGLSIVRAIVAAHGGTVSIGNGPPLGGAVVAVSVHI
ncbi:sensor histidine kinase [Actinoplanes sp. NPDC051343]|uniref:sensor histidine kinase n=1 Tax=Actinoplanes sp. NPDC051343 TaxID=3363906 RepID=UPI00378B5ED4